MGKEKNWFTISNLMNALVFIVMLALLISPAVKTVLIQGMMKIGLFQPELSLKRKVQSFNLPDISFENNFGQIIHLDDQKGKIVFINFWATWCPPCRAEMPSINTLNQLFLNKNVCFIMVNVDNDLNIAFKFMRRHHFNLPIYKAVTEVPEEVFSGSIPTTIILDEQSRIVFKHEGAADYTNTQFTLFLTNLVKESNPQNKSSFKEKIN